MRCSICKSEIPNGSSFCNICGSAIRTEVPVTESNSVKAKFSEKENSDIPYNIKSPKESEAPANPLPNIGNSNPPQPTASISTPPPPQTTSNVESESTPHNGSATASNSTPTNSGAKVTPHAKKSGKKKSKLIPLLLIAVIAVVAVIGAVSSNNTSPQTETANNNDFSFNDDQSEDFSNLTEDDRSPDKSASETVAINNPNSLIEYFSDFDDAYYKVYDAGFSGLNLRDKGSSDGEIIKVLQESELVLVYGIEDGWAFIKTADSRTEKNIYGWCSADYLKYSHDA